MSIFNEKVANKYDAYFTKPKGRYVWQAETELMKRLIDIDPGMKVLEIGCGTGLYSIPFARKGCDVTGIDISEEMLDIAREKSHVDDVDITLLNMNADKLKFNDGSFDRIFSMGVLDFVDDLSVTFEQAYRTLKPGGKISIAVVNRDSDWGKHYMDKAYNKGKVYEHAKFKSMEDLMAIHPEEIIGSGECLFIPPTADESLFTMEEEMKRKGTVPGGWINVVWQKK